MPEPTMLAVRSYAYGAPDVLAVERIPRPEPGDGQVLVRVHAAGGVGNLAVQLGRWKGAAVAGTASSADFEFVRSLGAETVVDYTATPFESVVRDLDLVFDNLVGEVEDRSLKVLKPGGILVTSVGFRQEDKARQHTVRMAAAGSCSTSPTSARQPRRQG